MTIENHMARNVEANSREIM